MSTKEIRSFITPFGQSILGVVKNETPDTIELENAIAMGVTPDPKTGQASLQFGPINPLAIDGGKGIWLKFYKSTLIEFHVKEDVKGHYNQMIGSVQIAPASALVGLDKLRKQ